MKTTTNGYERRNAKPQGPQPNYQLSRTQHVAPLSFPLWDSNALPWWACDRQTFQMRCQELSKARAWGKDAEARVGGGVEFTG